MILGEWLQEAEGDGKQRHQGGLEHPVESSLAHNPSPTQQHLKARALNTQRPCTSTGNHMSKGTWPRTEVPAGQGTLPAPHSRQPLSLLLPCPPYRAPQPLTTPVSNSYRREPKLQQSAASVGSTIPPTSAERDRVRLGGREHQ